MRRAVIFNADRTGYSVNQVADSGVMTVGELMAFLEDYDEDDLVILSHDRGYTYGGMSYDDELYENEDGSFERW